MPQATRKQVDVLIVGGGTAGCVLASRLSEDARRRVLLIEAGHDTPAGNPPADIANPFPLSYANPSYFTASAATGAGSAQGDAFSQPRIMGGGSSVMGMWAVRGLADDYDGWAAAGASGWSFQDVLPYFKRLEHDFDFGGAMHGTQGPTPLLRVPPERWPAFQRSIGRAAADRGLKTFPDIHACEEDGVFALPNSTDGNFRASSASCYLTAAVRARPNLEIRSEAQVHSLIFEDRRVVGARIAAVGPQARTSDMEVIKAGAVVVCCGAIHSPALLMRSGVGPATHLQALAIPPVLDLPDVGSNLQNHVVVHLGGLLKAGARQPSSMSNYALACIRASSGLPQAARSDLFYGLIARTGARPADNGMGLIAAGLYAPFSRGSVRLNASDPSGFPCVDFKALSDSRDATRLVGAARFALELLQSEALRSCMLELFVMPRKLPVKRLNAPGLVAAVGSAALSQLNSLPPVVRRTILRTFLGRERLMTGRSVTPEAFERVILDSATPMFHPAGTCALGAVVDASTKVRGLGGLFVADASIMPRIPRANTNLPTLMVAERASALLTQALGR